MSIYETNFNLFVERFVQISKEPFQFLSIFISYYSFIKFNTEIKNPILFDATCSGIQHLSALTKDSHIANLVNLTQNESPSDFYQYCINKIIEEIELLPDEKLRNKLKELKITRKWIKQSIMTVPYNVSIMGISDKLGEKYDKYYLDQIELEKLEGGRATLEQVLENIKIKKVAEQKLKKSGVILQETKEKGTYIFVPHPELQINVTPLYFTAKEHFKLAQIVHSTVLNIIPQFIQLKKYFDEIIELFDSLKIPFS
jgi:hypothetical protein